MSKNRHLTRERDTISKMIALYCKTHHGTRGDPLCDACQSLEAYAHQRLNHCRYRSEKPTCAKCPVHCYHPDRREQIRQVMRYSGPRMLLHHPILAIHHLHKGLRNPPSP